MSLSPFYKLETTVFWEGFFFFKTFKLFFLEKEKYKCALTQELTHHPFSAQDNAQSTEPRLPGLGIRVIIRLSDLSTVIQLVNDKMRVHILISSQTLNSYMLHYEASCENHFFCL